MASIPIYDGTSTFTPGLTPFGFYDDDEDFQKDADLVTKFCARRLGYPIVSIELQDINFYAAFEEAVTAYGNELYAYQIRDNQLNLTGTTLDSSVSLNNTVIYPNLDKVIKLSQNYGAEAGLGGKIPHYRGYIDSIPHVQRYDLNIWAENEGIDPGDLEITRVFYETPPASVRYFDPFATSGAGFQNMMDSFGFGGMSPTVHFMMMPLSFDIQTIQAIELNDQIRRSNFSFQIVNNMLTIFPIPKRDGKIWFEYIKSSDRGNSTNAGLIYDPNTKEWVSIDTLNKKIITNVSNAPYNNPVYSEINSVGRSWIFEYSLAACKETLGFIRGKYGSIPIPNDTVTLNHSDLISQGQSEKERLINKLREYFDQTSRKSLLERQQAESDLINKELNNIPYAYIYIA